MELREKIIEATIEEFNEKNLKFTMDDIAKKLSISKKTIYNLFKNKETLFLETTDYCFNAIKESERKIIEDDNLDIVEKIKKILIVLPEKYKNVDWRQVYIMKEKHEKVYEEVRNRIENQWEPTIELIEEGIKKQKIKPVSILLIKSMVQSTIEYFLSNKVLINNNIRYEDALNEMVNILMDGIKDK